MGLNSLIPKGNNDLNFRLERDQVVHLKNSCRFVCQPRQANNFYAVMAAKRFQTGTEKEIEHLLLDKCSKSTNKTTQNAVNTLRDFCKKQNLDESFQRIEQDSYILSWEV